MKAVRCMMGTCLNKFIALVEPELPKMPCFWPMNTLRVCLGLRQSGFKFVPCLTNKWGMDTAIAVKKTTQKRCWTDAIICSHHFFFCCHFIFLVCIKLFYPCYKLRREKAYRAQTVKNVTWNFSPNEATLLAFILWLMCFAFQWV